MNQEDRLLLEQLNEVISRNPRLLSYRLSLRSHQTHKQAQFKMWLAGFLFGVVTAASTIAFSQGLQPPRTHNTPPQPAPTSVETPEDTPPSQP